MKRIFPIMLLYILLAMPFYAQKLDKTNFTQPNESLPFKVGAGKTDITPDENNLPQGYSGIRDHFFCRAIVIDNGKTSTALVGVDQGMVSDELYEKITQHIEKEMNIPVSNIFIAPSHTHSAPWGAESAVEKGVIEVVKIAKNTIRNATINYKTGLSYLNINRNVIDSKKRLWVQYPNYEGSSDKTVTEITFKRLLGEPIAIYYNYAMHANMMFMSGFISADFPGETSKNIEILWQ